MNTYKRHRFPQLGGPLNHQLRRLALLSLQPKPPPVCRAIQISGKQHYRDLRIGAFNEWSRVVA
ncbi:MAG: hypothetical protein QNK24_04645 [Desulfuromusa sp.]|nr:hypothetical protein [Desulfuromusa sp.]